MLTHAFFVYGGGLPAVVIVGVEGKQPWRKSVLPTLKAAIESLTGSRVLWRDICIDGICVRNEDNTAWVDHIQFFQTNHEKKKFHRIVILARGIFCIYHPGE